GCKPCSKHRFGVRRVAFDHTHIAHEVIKLRAGVKRLAPETRKVFADGRRQSAIEQLPLSDEKDFSRARFIPGLEEMMKRGFPVLSLRIVIGKLTVHHCALFARGFLFESLVKKIAKEMMIDKRVGA